MALDRGRGRRRCAARWPSRCELAVELAALGVSEIVDENMANAARVHAIESGKDARGRTLVAFGGAAPLHAARLAEKLGLDRVLVPSNAGVGSAVGLSARADRLRDRALRIAAPRRVRSRRRQRAPGGDARRGRGDRAARRRHARLTETRSAFMRYRGQGHEIAVPLPTKTYGPDDAATLRAAFEDAYRRLYSRIIPGVEVEIFSWVLLLSAPHPVEPAAATPSPDALHSRTRPTSSGVRSRCGRVRPGRDPRAPKPAPGARIPGPAIIVEDETSTVVTRLFDAAIDRFGYIELTRRAN